jgi:RNA polymerase sigma-70 factor (ECF subfamily)
VERTAVEGRVELDVAAPQRGKRVAECNLIGVCYDEPGFRTVSKIMNDTETAEIGRLLEQASQGDPQSLGALFQIHHGRLLSIVQFRMDSRLRGRLDAADVLQEAFIEATERFAEFCQQGKMPFFLWLRFITMQKLLQIHRRHFGVQARDATREVSIYAGPYPQATSAVLAAHLLGKQTSPSGAAMRAESQLRMERALNTMDEIDREVLALRHFEQLGNGEVARVLGISDKAANNRYMRALKRLGTVLGDSS